METRVSNESSAGLDPVCGMSVTPDDAAGMVEYKGTKYPFCSQSCLRKFEEHPEQYATSNSKAPAAARPATPAKPTGAEAIYTCPMHPQVRQVGPGICPICGMALEPLEVTAGGADEQSPELRDMARRLWVSTPPTAALLLLAMGRTGRRGRLRLQSPGAPLSRATTRLFPGARGGPSLLRAGRRHRHPRAGGAGARAASAQPNR